MFDAISKPLKDLELPDITKQKTEAWKCIVKQAINEKNETELRKEIGKLDKVKEFANEEFGQKTYFKHLSLAEARTKFKFRAKMTQYIKRNYRNDRAYTRDLWKCDSCRTMIDTQSHVLWCHSYKNLRMDKDLENDKDLVNYIQDVLKIRSKMNQTK